MQPNPITFSICAWKAREKEQAGTCKEQSMLIVQCAYSKVIEKCCCS